MIAVYRALLDRDPDPEGLAHWCSSTDVRVLIKAVSDTEEHRRRVLLASGLTRDASDEREGLEDVGHRLLVADGLGQLDDRLPSPAVLRTLPWNEVADPWGRLHALVLGPYGRELADELVRRGCIPVARAGLSATATPSHTARGREGATGDRRGTLILTDELYLRALSRSRPDVIDGTVLRLLHPVGTRMGQWPEERRLAVLVARRRLHSLGFVEVSQVVGRRHGGEPVVLDTSFAMPVPGELLTVPGAAVPDGHSTTAVWLVVRRVPVGDRT